MSKNSYQIMKSAISKDYTPTEEEYKKINHFFMTRMISNDPSTIYIANAINNYTVPNKALYNFVKYSTLDRVAFVNYNKKDKEQEYKIKVFRKFYKCNSQVAKEYLELSTDKQVQDIIDIYKGMKL